MPLIYILGQSVTHGTLNLTSTGSFTYSPNPNYFGTDIFTFQVSDGTNTSSVATGSITVNSINDAPVAVGDTAVGTEDTQIMINPVLNDTDVE